MYFHVHIKYLYLHQDILLSTDIVDTGVYIVWEISKKKKKKKKVKLATIVEGDSKAPFSVATTPRCREGRCSFPWIAPLYP